MILCNNAGLEKAAKYGVCRNQPFELGDNDDDSDGELGDCGALIFVFLECSRSHRMMRVID
jgi:hypothetical protein